MKKQSLLQKAKKIKGRVQTRITEEDIELALAWVNDTISYGQVAKVYGYSGPSAAGYCKLAQALKYHMNKKRPK